MKVLPSSPEAYRLFHEASLALARIEARGWRIDTAHLGSACNELDRSIRDLEWSLRSDPLYSRWRRAYGERAVLGSGEQLSHLLFDLEGVPYPHERTATGKYRTDVEVMSKVDLPFVRDWCRLKKHVKVRSTYLEGIRREVVDGYLHPSYNLAGGGDDDTEKGGARSFRLSSNSPNLQNTPIRDPEWGEVVRKCFIPRDEHRLAEIDFAGIEVRVGACYHRDPVMLRYIEDKTTDMHRDMAAELYLISEKEAANKKIRYCNPPEAPIWMADLSFKPLGEIKVGDAVIGWNRSGSKKRKYGGGVANRKRLVKSIVTAVHEHTSPIVRVTFSSGRVIRCSPDHRWASIQPQGGWNEYQEAHPGRVLSFIVDPVNELPEDKKHTAGWLGGIFDGEGTCTESGFCIAQSWTHNRKVCLRMEEACKELGFPYSWRNSSRDCLSLGLLGGLDTEIKFLNWCNPARRHLVVKRIAKRSSFFKQDKVISVEPDGMGTVIGMTTTSGNYVAWGYGSKNCGKNQFVFPQFYGSVYFQCAPALWESAGTLALSDGTSLRDHLKSKGITRLGECVPGGEPREGTFEAHVADVERDFWGRRFSVYAAWKKTWWEAYQRTGGFSTKTGFRCQGAYRRNQVINMPVQCDASQCLLWSLVRLERWLRKGKMRSLILGPIHDSMVLDLHRDEAREVLAKARGIMTEDLPSEWGWIICPLEVESEIAPEKSSWFAKEKEGS